MLVNINLLPGREKKSLLQRAIPFAVAFILLIAGTGVALKYISFKQDAALLQQQLETTRKVKQSLEQQADANLSSNAVQQLDQAVKWASDTPISTVKVLKHLVSLLPERGFFTKYTYSDEQMLKIWVQFDSLSEVSAYLHQLGQSELVVDPKLLSVETIPLSDMVESTTDVDLVEAPEQSPSWLPRYQAQFEMKPNAAKLSKEGS